MELIDLTQTLTEDIPVYPGDTPFSSITRAQYEKGYRVDDLHMSGGIGTHIDAPAHFCKGGKTIEGVSLDRCHGPACVLHLEDRVEEHADYGISVDELLAWEKLHGPIPEGAIVLAHTGWSKHWHNKHYCGLDENGLCHFPHYSAPTAPFLVERKIKAVGIDTLSLDAGDTETYPVHTTLLAQEICLVENLVNLDQLPATGAHVWLVPMKIGGVPEAPIRAFAWLPKTKEPGLKPELSAL